MIIPHQLFNPGAIIRRNYYNDVPDCLYLLKNPERIYKDGDAIQLKKLLGSG